MEKLVIACLSGDSDKLDNYEDCCTNEQEIEFSLRRSLHPPDKTLLRRYNNKCKDL